MIVANLHNTTSYAHSGDPHLQPLTLNALSQDAIQHTRTCCTGREPTTSRNSLNVPRSTVWLHNATACQRCRDASCATCFIPPAEPYTVKVPGKENLTSRMGEVNVIDYVHDTIAQAPDFRILLSIDSTLSTSTTISALEMEPASAHSDKILTIQDQSQ